MTEYDAAKDGRDSYDLAIAEIRKKKILSGEILPDKTDENNCCQTQPNAVTTNHQQED